MSVQIECPHCCESPCIDCVCEPSYPDFVVNICPDDFPAGDLCGLANFGPRKSLQTDPGTQIIKPCAERPCCPIESASVLPDKCLKIHPDNMYYVLVNNYSHKCAVIFIYFTISNLPAGCELHTRAIFGGESCQVANPSVYSSNGEATMTLLCISDCISLPVLCFWAVVRRKAAGEYMECCEPSPQVTISNYEYEVACLTGPGPAPLECWGCGFTFETCPDCCDCCCPEDYFVTDPCWINEDQRCCNDSWATYDLTGSPCGECTGSCEDDEDCTSSTAPSSKLIPCANKDDPGVDDDCVYDLTTTYCFCIDNVCEGGFAEYQGNGDSCVLDDCEWCRQCESAGPPPP